MAEQSTAVHRRARTGYAVAAVLLFVAGIVTRWLWPEGAAILFGTGATWVWAVVGYAYHHGWLRRERQAITQTAAITIKRGREYENGPYHYAGDGCRDHV